MIEIRKHRSFKKSYLKISEKEKVLFMQRIKILQTNSKHPLLKIHSLKGNLQGFHAFSLSGDLRVRFRWLDKKTIRLYKIGTHNQVY